LILACLVAAGCQVQRMAPPLAGLDLDGKPWDLAAQRGKPVLLVFWAPWSPMTSDQLRAVMEAAAPDVHIVGVSLDATRGMRSRVLVNKAGWPYSTVLGTPQVAQAWDGMNVLPTLVRVNASGRVTAWHEGFATAEDVRRLLQL
jgi:cytochrome c biogenesis protein CcmG/thiol:disulfide interchange protein DsbE